MTCYVPCHRSNLFKIKSICSFHTLCPTSLLQSIVDYSIALKTGCPYNKLITYFVVNCIRIFWNMTSTYFLSLCLSNERLSSFSVAHWLRNNFYISFTKHTLFTGSEVPQVGEKISVTLPGLPLPA